MGVLEHSLDGSASPSVSLAGSSFVSLVAPLYVSPLPPTALFIIHVPRAGLIGAQWPVCACHPLVITAGRRLGPLSISGSSSFAEDCMGLQHSGTHCSWAAPAFFLSRKPTCVSYLDPVSFFSFPLTHPAFLTEGQTQTQRAGQFRAQNKCNSILRLKPASTPPPLAFPGSRLAPWLPFNLYKCSMSV